jgi:hypothetical protein
MGLLMQDFEKETALRKKFEVVATFKSAEPESAQFIAIMEGKELPIYVFTYNIEMS